MKPRYMKSRYLIWMCSTLALLLLAGCAPKAKIRIYKPAEITTKGIRKVAVGRFEVMDLNRLFKAERDGDWHVRKIKFSKKQMDAISDQVRAQVINLLSATPYFHLVYTDEFQKLENDEALQNLIAAGGYRTADVDAVLNGKIWLDVVNIDANDIDKVPLEFVQGGSEDSFNYRVEVLAYWPYKSIRGTMALEMKLTQLNPTEIIAVILDTREGSYKIGGSPYEANEIRMNVDRFFGGDQTHVNSQGIEESSLVLPSFDQLVANLAESVAAQFIRRVAVTEVEVEYPIAVGGDETAKLLIEVGAYEKAIETLNRLLDQSPEKNANDIYNLGLCYEAVGEYGLAATIYNDAIMKDPENLIYAQGMGRIERLKRENRLIRDQLTNK